MRELSLRAPWREVAAACDRMVEWLSFTLWVRTAIDTARDMPAVVVQTIETRCPGFLPSRANNRDHTTLWHDLAAWVDHHHFAAAREGGWLDAVHHYVGRDARADAAWSLWETTVAEWSAKPPAEFPSFEDWHGRVLAMTSQNQEQQHGVSSVRFQEGVARYLDWETLAFWVRSLAEVSQQLPPPARATLDSELSGFWGYVASTRPNIQSYSTWLWDELLKWVENHLFSEARDGGWLDGLRTAVRRHLRSERTVDYWSWCAAQWAKDPPHELPDLPAWRAAADGFVVR